jgi:hypothetical protein
MTGLLNNKYHVAILKDDTDFISHAKDILRKCYDKIVIETFADSHSLIEGVNLNKANNSPFDLTVLSPDEYVEKLILQKRNPDMKILVCKTVEDFQKETVNMHL